MSAKTYSNQTAKFIAILIQSVPTLSNVEMQYWIENPNKLKMFLRASLRNREEDCDVQVPKELPIHQSNPSKKNEVKNQGWGEAIVFTIIVILVLIGLVKILASMTS